MKQTKKKRRREQQSLTATYILFRWHSARRVNKQKQRKTKQKSREKKNSEVKGRRRMRRRRRRGRERQCRLISYGRCAYMRAFIDYTRICAVRSHLSILFKHISFFFCPFSTSLLPFELKFSKYRSRFNSFLLLPDAQCVCVRIAGWCDGGRRWAHG